MNDTTLYSDININTAENLAQILVDPEAGLLALRKLGFPIRELTGLEYTDIIPQMEELDEGLLEDDENDISKREINFKTVKANEVKHELSLRGHGLRFSLQSLIKISQGMPDVTMNKFLELFKYKVRRKIVQTIKKSMAEQIKNGFYLNPDEGIRTIEDLKANHKLIIDEVIQASDSKEYEQKKEQLILEYLVKGRTELIRRLNRDSLDSKLTIVLPVGSLDNYKINKISSANVQTANIFGLEFLKLDANVDIIFFNTDELRYGDGPNDYFKDYMLIFEGKPFEILMVNLNKYPGFKQLSGMEIDEMGFCAVGSKTAFKSTDVLIKALYAVGCHLTNRYAPLLINFRKGA